MVKPRGLVLPAGSVLFHGSLEDIKGDLRTGGYDGVLWFADVPAIAQLYIPRSGGTMYVGSDTLARPSQDPSVQAVQALIGLHYDLSQVRWDNIGRAQSYLIPEDWRDVGLNKDLDQAVERRLAKAGHPGEGTPGWKRYEFHFAGDRLLPPGGVQQGQLCVATTKRDLVLWPKALGEGDLMEVQYHDIKGFRDAKKAGYDGVMIDDFAQSEVWGNFGHLSVGVFASSLDALKTTCVPATYEEFQRRRFHTDAWPDASVRPYFHDLLEGRAANPDEDDFDEHEWLYHVTMYRNLATIAERGLQPGSEPGIGTGVYDAHRQGAVFLTEEDGINFWAERAEQWAEYNSDDPYQSGMVPVLLRVASEYAPGCEPDQIGTKDAKADAFRCGAIEPDALEVWNGTEEGGEWIPVEDWSDVDLDAAFQDEEDEEVRTLRSAFPGPLIPDANARERADNPASRRGKARARARARARALRW